MSSYISCYNENKELESFKVPKPVYIYVLQLEYEIKYKRGGVQRLYPFRFDGNYNIEDWGVNTPIVPDETMEELLKKWSKKMKGWKDISQKLMVAYYTDIDEVRLGIDVLAIANVLNELISQFKEVYEIEDDVEDDWVIKVGDIKQLIWELEK